MPLHHDARNVLAQSRTLLDSLKGSTSLKLFFGDLAKLSRSLGDLAEKELEARRTTPELVDASFGVTQRHIARTLDAITAHSQPSSPAEELYLRTLNQIATLMRTRPYEAANNDDVAAEGTAK